VPLVREAARGEMSAEGKERAGRVVAALTGPPTGDRLRARRAVAVLEWSDRPDAAAHLRALAAGDPAATVTREAQTALSRSARGGDRK
jgi:hypothetical protein